MNRRWLRTILAFCILHAVGALAVAGDNGGQAAEVAKLIKELGHDRQATREAAEKRLTQIGWRAVPALKGEQRHRDPEVSQRAQRIHGRLTHATPAQQNAIRQKAEAAFADGRYEDAAELYGLLAYQQTYIVPNRLWLGHAYQLAGRWADAADAYQLALNRTEFVCSHPEVRLTHPRGVWDGSTGEAEGNGAMPVSVLQTYIRRERHTQSLLDQANQIRLLIGLIQREAVGDLNAAAETFAEPTGYVDILKQTMPELLAEYEDYLRLRMDGEKVEREHSIQLGLIYPLWCLDELARTQERMGQKAAALATWDRARLIRLLYGSGHYTCDIAAMGRLLQGLGGDAPLPEQGPLLVMSPEKESYNLDFADPKTLARAHATPYMGGMPGWRFVCAAPPGLEIAALEVSCDIEQHELRYGGQFSCWLRPEGLWRIELGGISWPDGKAAGRDVVTKRFDIPAGAGVVHIQSNSGRGRFKVHGLTIRPTFRPRAAAGVVPTGGANILSRALPEGGILTYDGTKRPNGTACTGFPVGEHTFSYDVPGRTDGKQLAATLEPGRRYGLFINLDSPFARTLTNLHSLSAHPPAHSSLVRLPDGRWLAAYAILQGQGYHVQPKIMLSTSRDLATWDTPWELPQNSVFGSCTPSLVVDEKGTIWLAWFSNRLHLERTGGGYRLWLASSRDGKVWSRPMSMDGGRDGAGTHVQLARGPKGKYWLFVENRAASADSPSHLGQPSPIVINGQTPDWLESPHVVWDSASRMHMVYLAAGGAIQHTTSDDGTQWTEPVTILAGEKDQHVSNPQLILGKEQRALLYEDGRGDGWLQRLTPGADPNNIKDIGSPVMVADHLAPLVGSRVCLTPDGRLIALAGSDTVWLLHGKLDRILRGPPQRD